MLILSRKLGESVVLPDTGVTIRVLKISGRRIQLGIEAADDVLVRRHEVDACTMAWRYRPESGKQTSDGTSGQQ